MSEEVPCVVVRHLTPTPAANVWAVLKDQGCLVSQVEDVRGIEVLSVDRVLSGDPVERVVSWWVWLKGFELRWQEKQQLDCQRRRLDFQQTQGMFATYGGFWQVTSSGDGAVVELHLEIDTGMPYLAGFIDPVISNAFKELAHELLYGLEQLSVHSQPACKENAGRQSVRPDR